MQSLAPGPRFSIQAIILGAERRGPLGDPEEQGPVRDAQGWGVGDKERASYPARSSWRGAGLTPGPPRAPRPKAAAAIQTESFPS
jgi:hypothetical protein